MKTSVLLSVAFASAVVIGADLTTKSGTVYKDYSIIEVTHRGVTVEHADGLANVPLDELPEDMKSTYAPQVETAKQKHAIKKAEWDKREKARRERKKIETALKKISLEVLWIKCSQVLKGRGVHAQCQGYTNDIFLDGLDTSSLVDGVRIPQTTDIKYNGKTCRGNRIYFIGSYSYSSAGGAVNTIPHFTFDKDKALAYVKVHPKAKIVGMEKDRSFEIDMQNFEWEHRRREEQMRQRNVRTMQRQLYMQNRGRR